MQENELENNKGIRGRWSMTNEEAIKIIEDMRNNVINLILEKAQINALDMAIEALKIQDTYKWIPCSERLPNKNGRYLVTRGLNAAGALWNRVYIANYSDLMGLKREKIFWDGNVGKSDFKRLEDVIAWMPLAEPYKEE